MMQALAADPVTDDLALLWRYHQGEVDAFMAIYSRHVRPLLLYARCLTRDPALAEDLVQEVFLRILGTDPAQVRTSVQALLYVSVRNAAVDAARRNEVRRRHESRAAREPRMATPEGAQDALDDLPAEQREVVILKIHGEMTFEEIGGLLGVPLQTAASRYRYALEKLAAILSEERGGS